MLAFMRLYTHTNNLCISLSLYHTYTSPSVKIDGSIWPTLHVLLLQYFISVCLNTHLHPQSPSIAKTSSSLVFLLSFFTFGRQNYPCLYNKSILISMQFKSHYVVITKTPVSFKIPWGITLFTANSQQSLRCCLLARKKGKRSDGAKFTSKCSTQNWKSPTHSRHKNMQVLLTVIFTFSALG